MKYFTLPGKRAWDIFFFEKHDIVKKIDRGFPDVRFCDNSSLFYTEAKSLLGNTVGIKANFETIVNDGYKKFWDGFPYDIYNLDFCGTCFPDNQPPFSDTFKAIKKIILRHSENKMNFPFVIFLTLKALKSETNKDTISELKCNIEENRADSNFNALINEIIPSSDALIESKYEDFIIISIPKIIAHIAKQNCNVEILNRAKYKRKNAISKELYFIVKFVFKFTSLSPSLRLNSSDNNYIKNVNSIMRFDNIKLIDKTDCTQDILKSHNELIKYIDSLK